MIGPVHHEALPILTNPALETGVELMARSDQPSREYHLFPFSLSVSLCCSLSSSSGENKFYIKMNLSFPQAD